MLPNFIQLSHIEIVMCPSPGSTRKGSFRGCSL